MSASPSIPESRSTSAILTVLGREAPTRTPTDCCASISRGERVSPTTPRHTWTWLPPSSMGDLAKPSAGSRRLSDSPSFWKYRQQQVLRPPHETTRQIHACLAADSVIWRQIHVRDLSTLKRDPRAPCDARGSRRYCPL